MTPQAPALHSLGVGELLDAAIYTYRKSFVTLIGIGAVMALPIMLVHSAVAFFDPSLDQLLAAPFSPIGGNAIRDFPDADYYLSGNAMNMLMGPAAIVIQAGAFAFAVSEGRMGRWVTIGGAYRHALRRWLSLLISAILIQLAVLAVFIPLIVSPFLLWNAGYISRETPWVLVDLLILGPFYVPLLFPSVCWSLTTPAIMLENLGVFKAMGRSWCLVGKSFWRTVAVLLVAGLLVNFLMYGIFLVVQYGALLLPDFLFLRTLVISAGGLVAGIVIQPLAYVVITLLYYDLRVRHEGYDLRVTLDHLKQPATAVATEAPA